MSGEQQEREVCEELGHTRDRLCRRCGHRSDPAPSSTPPAGHTWVQLPTEDVDFIAGFEPDRDRTASRADMVRVIEHLQAALLPGGEQR